jgi:chorismate synthase
MANTYGNNIRLAIFGGSHDAEIGMTLSGFPAGVRLPEAELLSFMARRAPGQGAWATARKEPDVPVFTAGVTVEDTENGKVYVSDGTPMRAVIVNTNQRSGDYEALADTPRPSHADYTAECKYRGYQDHRGGGHFSGRVTAAIVAAGSILELALSKKGILIGTHIKKLHGIEDRDFCSYREDIDKLNNSQFPTLSDDIKDKMTREILYFKERGDSVGGILETAVIGMPAGVGEPWFDSLEGALAHALYSVPGIKGIEFGDGFALSDMLGSEANDPLIFEAQSIKTVTNRNGGINGGISNGMPIRFETVIKPTPSIGRKQQTVDLENMTCTEIEIRGRHDPAVIHRARAVIDAVTALAVVDLLIEKYGRDGFEGERK